MSSLRKRGSFSILLALGAARLLISGTAHWAGGVDRTLERLGQSTLLATADAAEGARAFRANRPPTFTGR